MLILALLRILNCGVFIDIAPVCYFLVLKKTSMVIRYCMEKIGEETRTVLYIVGVVSRLLPALCGLLISFWYCCVGRIGDR